ncbi:MAG: hypothetical protein ACQESR_25495 [Planctomycetota bacterium]
MFCHGQDLVGLAAEKVIRDRYNGRARTIPFLPRGLRGGVG